MGPRRGVPFVFLAEIPAALTVRFAAPVRFVRVGRSVLLRCLLFPPARRWLLLRSPRRVLRIVCYVGEAVGRLSGVSRFEYLAWDCVYSALMRMRLWE